MIYKLSTALVPIFSGTYETGWDIEEIDNDGNELPVCYDHRVLLKGIARAYQNNAEEIKNELGVTWIKNIKFPGGTWSPREYNFSTDCLDMDVNVDYRSMIRYLDTLENDVKFAEWLREHYSSRSGFISFTPDNWREIRENIADKGNEAEQAVGALIRWASLQSDHEVFGYMGSIEQDIFKEWRGNGYGGTDYWVECAECNGHMEYDMDGEWHCANEECVVNKTVGLSI